jgi:putative sigma-54 modulation protein
MRVEVVGRGIDITDAIREHAETKCEKLHRYFNGIQLITVTVTQEDHAKHGLFDVELIIDVEHHEDFVCRARGDDLYGTIDLAVNKGQRQLTDFKEKLRNDKR